MRTRAAILAAALGSLTGCGGDAVEALDEVGESTSPILGGSASGASQDAGVLLTYRLPTGEERLCSGVLVAPNLLATARHCIVSYDDGPYQCGLNGDTIPLAGGDGGTITEQTDPGQISLYFGYDPDDPILLGIDSPDAHGAQIFDDSSTTLCGRDIAFVVLDRAIEGAALLPLRLDTPEEGELLTVMGWGQTMPGSSFLIARHFLSGLPITEVTAPEPNPEVMGLGLPPRSFATGPAICEGDSGGPALDELAALVGVASGFIGTQGDIGTSTCDTGTSLFTQLGPFRAILEDALAAADQPLWIAGEPPPGSVEADGECASDTNCASGLCVLEGDVGRCAQPCRADADCDAGELCDLQDEGESFCAPEAEVRHDGASGCSVAEPSGPASSRAWLGLLLGLGGLVLLRRQYYGFFRPARGRGIP